jgi:RNA-directed DNA polymerase
MEESNVEGVATHDDPESCVGAREGVGEAFDRGTCGLGIEPRNQSSGTPTPLTEAEGNTLATETREAASGPARSQTPGTYGTSLHENREISRVLDAMARRAASGRP